jgi:hypothetical protein
MAKYLVQLKTTIYLDLEVEAVDEEQAEQVGINEFAELIDPVELPMPLEFDRIEAWEIQEQGEQ